MFQRVILVAAILVLAGCGTTKKTMESWVGSKESVLVASWGAPTSAIDTRDGMRTLTWENYWGQYNQNVCRRSFTIDEQAIIRTWSYSGCLF